MAGDFTQFGLVPINGAGGQVNATPAAPNPGANLNPFVDAGPFGKCQIGPINLPGILFSIDGAETPHEWAVQKGTSTSGATRVWRGRKIAESIKLVLKLLTKADYDAYYLVQTTIDPPGPAKPPTLPIVNATINFARINNVTCNNCPPPKWNDKGYWIAEIDVGQQNPSKAAGTGPADPAKKLGEPSANDKLATELQNVVNEAAKV